MDPVNIPTKFEVRRFIRSLDNRGYSKIWAVPGYAHAPLSPKFLIRFCSHGLSEYICQNLTFLGLAIPEIIGGTSKIWGVPGFVHPPYSPKFLKGFCSHGPCEYTYQV